MLEDDKTPDDKETFEEFVDRRSKELGVDFNLSYEERVAERNRKIRTTSDDVRYRAWASRPINEDRITIYMMRYSRMPDGLAQSAYATFGVNSGVTWNDCEPYATIEPFLSLPSLVHQAMLGFVDIHLIDHLLQLGTNLADVGELQSRDK